MDIEVNTEMQNLPVEANADQLNVETNNNNDLSVSKIPDVDQNASDDGEGNLFDMLRDRLKTDADKVDPAEDGEEEVPGDSIGLSISDTLYSLNKKFVNRTFIKESYLKMYDELQMLRRLLVLALIAIIFFLKPGWCYDRGDKISETCEIDSDGIKYNLANSYQIDLYAGLFILYIIIGFITFGKVLTAIFSSNKMDLQNAIILLCVFFELLLFAALRKLNFITYHYVSCNASGAVIVVFLVCEDFAFTCLKRLCQIVWLAKNITLLYVLNILFFTLLFRSITWDSKLASGTKAEWWTTANWSNFGSTLFTWIITCSGDNFPGVVIDAYGQSFIYYLIMIAFVLFSQIIIMSVLTGAYANYFGAFSVKRQNDLISEDKNFGKIITALYNQGDKMTQSSIKETFNNYKNHGIKFAIDSLRVCKDDLKTFREVLQKLDKTPLIKKETQKNKAWSSYKSFVVQIMIFAIDMSVVFCPVIRLDFKPATTIVEQQIYWYSEMACSYVFVEAAFIFYYSRKNVKSMKFMVRLVSSVVTFIAGNYQEFGPTEIMKDEHNSHAFIFKLWAFSCQAKIISVDNVLRYSKRWGAVKNSIGKVVPALKQLLLMYFIAVLIFSNIGICMFGGNINSSSKDKFKAVGLGDMTDNNEMFNFNDNINAFFFQISLPMGGMMSTIMMALVSNPGIKIAGGIYFAMYYFLGVLMLMNIILGTILNYIGDYLTKSEENEKKKDQNKALAAFDGIFAEKK